MELNKVNCMAGSCYKCQHCKDLDEKQREKDSWKDVELFRIVKGKLPQSGDFLPKSVAKEFIDRFHFGNESYPDSSVDKGVMETFAFHVFSSTNLAYENDLKK